MVLFYRLDIISRARGAKISLPITYLQVKKLQLYSHITEQPCQLIASRQTVYRLESDSFFVFY